MKVVKLKTRISAGSHRSKVTRMQIPEAWSLDVEEHSSSFSVARKTTRHPLGHARPAAEWENNRRESTLVLEWYLESRQQASEP